MTPTLARRVVAEGVGTAFLVAVVAVAARKAPRATPSDRLWLRFALGGLCALTLVVVASAPHRAEAFAAARFCIDALKATVPIWKRETWRDGESWGLEAQHIVELAELDDAGALAEEVE